MTADGKSEPLTELVTKQKKFLHDLASPVAIANGMIEMAMMELSKKSITEGREIECLQKALRATEKIVKLIEDNRSEIRGVPSS